LPGTKDAPVPKGQKGRRGFLEQIYLGDFDRDVFEGFFLTVRESRAEDIIRKYRDLIEDYPPEDLEKKGKIPDSLWRGMKEIGLFGLNVPEVYGGAGLSLTGYLSVLQAMARTDMALAITPTAHLSIGIKGILLYGTQEQKEKYLPPAASGELIFAYALTEPRIGSDARHIEMTATLSGDGSHYVLNGQKAYITNGNYAGGLTVFAQMDEEQPGYMGAFIVETSWKGVTVGPDMPKMGLKISSTAPITLEDVHVPAENLLGQPGDGFNIAMTILNYGRLGLGAASAGAMEQSAADMLTRASSRRQFGIPIRDFPLIQEKMVKAKVHGFAVSAMSAFTSRILEEDPTARAAVESSHVKLYGTTRAWDTLYDALQTAGGAGYLATQPYEKRMRDFRVTTLFEGTTEIHSIYPALFLFRSLGKDLKASGRGRIRQLLFLLKEAFKRPKWPLAYRTGITGRASRTARRNTRRVRKMVHLGLILYGRKVAEKEFLLKRITELSLGSYGLLAILALVDARRQGGLEIRENLSLLDYFTEEVRESVNSRRRIFPNRREKSHRRVFDGILEEGPAVPGEEGQGNGP
jgi:acyl-CoA dehydrogenase family protein 9